MTSKTMATVGVRAANGSKRSDKGLVTSELVSLLHSTSNN